MFSKGKLDFIALLYRISQQKNENSVLPVVILSDWSIRELKTNTILLALIFTLTF